MQRVMNNSLANRLIIMIYIYRRAQYEKQLECVIGAVHQ